MKYEAILKYCEFLFEITDKSTRMRLLLSVLMLGSTTAMGSLSPIFLKKIVDFLTVHRGPTTLLIIYVFLYLAANFFVTAGGEIRWSFYGIAEERIKANVSKLFFKRIFSLPHHFFSNQNQAAVSQVMNVAVQANRGIMINTLLSLFPAAIEFIFACCVLVSLGHYVVILVLGTYAVAFVTMNARHTIALTHINRTAGAASLMSSGLLGDAILNVDTVKYFGALSSVSQRFSDSVHRVEAIWSSFYRKRISGGIWRGLAFVATLGTCICYAVHRLLAGEIGIGDFVLINAYVFQVCRPLEGTAMAIRDVRQGLTQMEPYFSIIEQSIIEAASDDVLTVSGSKNPIVFERVDFAYSSQRRILKSVSFEIPAGTITAIVGETGSGKSTIAKLLFGLYPPDEGQIWIEGEPLTRGTQERIARRIAVVPQDIFLFQETIAFNIGIARPEATILEIIQAAERANVHTLIDALPEKYETRIGVNGLTLSGGERQRLAIARALLKDPDIIIFDEATSSLDVLTEDNIIKDLLAAIDGKTLILIAHRFSSIKVAHQVIVMEGGAVADIGTPSELAKRDGWYKKMMAIQSTATDSNSRGV